MAMTASSFATGSGPRCAAAQDGFRRLALGQLVSGIGDWMVTLALMVLVLDVSGSSAAVGARARAATASDVDRRPARRPRRPAMGPSIDDAGDGRRARRHRARHPARRRPVVDLCLGVPARARRADLRPGAGLRRSRSRSARCTAARQRRDAGLVVRHDPDRRAVLRARLVDRGRRRPGRRVRRRRSDVRRLLLVHRRSSPRRHRRAGRRRRRRALRRCPAVADRARRWPRRIGHGPRPRHVVLDGCRVRPGRPRGLDVPVRGTRRPVRRRRGGRPRTARRRRAGRHPRRSAVRRRCKAAWSRR